MGNRVFSADEPSRSARLTCMKNLEFIIEKSDVTGLYVGWVPGIPGAHSQGATLEELEANLKEVIDMLLEDGPSYFCKKANQQD